MGEKYGLNFRLVEEKDADFIVKLRTDERLARYLHPTDNNISKQKEWVQKYKQREKDGLDFYYIFEDLKNQQLGLSRIYDVQKQSFTVGSWIFSPNAPLGTSILGDIIVKEIGFENLGIGKCLFDVRKGNIHVLKYHMTYHPTKINEDDLIILPFLIYFSLKLIPKEIMDECKEEAKDMWKDGKPKRWHYAIPIIIIYVLIIAIIVKKIFFKN
ncbi:hypothetical protein AGMMS49546_31630 [Spirochaetia bacterium]|nr:hypothetical protein AGMMS49546_31630 [Spirochaetia bacterium]